MRFGSWSSFPMWSCFLLAILASLSLAKREEEDATLLQRLTASKDLSLAAREACGPPVKWPCDNDMVAKFPLQVINSDHKNCSAGRAAFDRLDLSTGEYTPLCYVPEHCFNACGISPETNEIFCREKLGGKTGNNLVRVDCPLNMTEVELGLPITPVEGSLCFFGKIPGTYAANFDVHGSYWFKRDRGNEGEIYEITNSSIFDLNDDGTTEAQNTKISSITSIVQRANLDRLADLNVLKLDLGQANGPGEQSYVVGCWGHHVYLQQVSGNLTNAEPIELTMIGDVDVKGRNSGAQWLFNGSVYCAYNDGKTGVIEVVLSETTFDGPTNGTVRAGRVNSSAKTSSNDGLNCLNAATPFPPCPPLETTTSAAPITSTLPFADVLFKCGPPVKWPCGNKKISSFPLQLINSDPKNCSAGRAAIDRLDLNTGEYTPLCYVPGHCFNGCGISPETNEIFCREKLGGKTGNNLVRIDCPLNMTEVELGLPITPVEGSLCFFGKIPGTYASNFDVNGSFWFKRDRGNEGEIYEITNSTLVDRFGSTEAQDTNLLKISSITSIVQRANLNRLADLNVLKLDLGQANGPGEQAYLVGCWGKHVYLQQVSGNLTNAEPIELTMIGVDMTGRNSGAQWLFNGSVYCAYNDGKTGVIEVVLSETTLDGPTNGTVRAGRVNSSAKTNSNDGLNCLNAATPFPECPPLPTTTPPTATTSLLGFGTITATTTTMEAYEFSTTPPLPTTTPPTATTSLTFFEPGTIFPTTTTMEAYEATTTTMEGFEFDPTTSNVGSGDGDPHIHTFDGQHYLLLSQGSFMFWHFSGVEAETLTDQKFLKKVPVDFKIYTHYSGHESYTKGLLLLDSSGHHQRSLELTSESCRWLTKTTPEQSWREVEGPEVLASPDFDGDEMTAFDFKRSRGQKMHVELLMKTQQGFNTVGKLFVSCRPGQHLNVKIKMFSEKEVHLVKGQLGASHDPDPQVQLHNGSVASFFKESGQELRMDQDFETRTDWEQLGGSPDASTYLQEVDDEGPAVLKSCTKQEEDEARDICHKYLGTSDAMTSGSSLKDFETQRAILKNFQETLADCIFDVCVGGGETAAELAAEILNAF